MLAHLKLPFQRMPMQKEREHCEQIDYWKIRTDALHDSEKGVVFRKHFCSHIVRVAGERHAPGGPLSRYRQTALRAVPTDRATTECLPAHRKATKRLPANGQSTHCQETDANAAK